MNLNQAPHHKYYCRDKPEEIYHKYRPTSGAAIVNNSTWIDSRIINAANSGIQVDCEVFITSWRICFHLMASGIEHVVDMFYDEIRIIAATGNYFSSDYGVKIADTSNNFIILKPTRPHFVAVELYVAIASQIMNGNAGLLNKFGPILRQLRTSTIKVPDDFASLKGDEYIKNWLSLGFCFPINGSPYLNESTYTHVLNQFLLSGSDANIQSTSSVSNTSLQAAYPNKISSNMTVDASPSQMHLEDSNRSQLMILVIPELREGVVVCVIQKWHKTDGDSFVVGDTLFSVASGGEFFNVDATYNGSIQEILVDAFISVRVNQTVAYINVIKPPPQEYLSGLIGADNSSNSRSLVSTADISCSLKTLDAVKSGSIPVASGEIPQFSPSLGAVPAGFASTGTNESDLLYAIANPLVGFQSFFNDLNVLGMAGINDDMINLPCFDEDVYCKLVIEMHRYTLAQVIDQKDEIARKNANLGTVVGGLLSVFTLNPLAMFFGRNVGHSISDKGKRVDEFLPNPQLLFYQDENSYLSWNRAQVSSSRLRRLIIARQVKDNGMVYFRLIPAMVTPHQILPMQLFCFNSNLYFYRPFSAGIEPRQTNYDAERIQRLYTHSRLGESTRTEIELSIFGRVVDPYPYKLDRFVSQRLDYFYADFETQPGSIF